MVDLTSRLVQVASENPPGNEGAAAEAFAATARSWGLEARLDRVGKDRANVLVTSERRAGEEASVGPLLYCGHLDTVPAGDSGWDHDPFGGSVSDGRVFGRGTVDMKGGLAAMLGGLAALQTADPELASQVTLGAVVGEEVDCAGSTAFVAAHDLSACRWLVIAEPTNLDLVVAQKGALHLKVTFTGRSAHGAHPENGVNAVQHLAQLVVDLQVLQFNVADDPWLGRPTLSANVITGGAATNVVPGICSVVLDLRTVPSQDHLITLALIEEACARLTRDVDGLTHQVEVLNNRPSTATEPDDALITAAQRTVRRVLGTDRTVRGVSFYSDASVLQPAMEGIPTLLFGPGETAAMHQVNESVAITDLAAATRFFATLPSELIR
ncbi:M20 family metallopeptidase [Flexivirga caeni]|uniref:M20 family metallopeptidase n=1 Tax=Flexivirga caeni TaxID=2294115 RepID=UPI00248266AB|nr:M20 family metallopeptidase [Flexivirga caeni]